MLVGDFEEMVETTLQEVVQPLNQVGPNTPYCSPIHTLVHSPHHSPPRLMGKNNSRNITDEKETSNEVLNLSSKKCKIKRRDNPCYLNFEATYMANIEDEIYVDQVVNEDVSDSHSVVKCIL